MKRSSSSEESAINAQMVKDGYAHHYAQFNTCPNGAKLATIEAQGRAEKLGP